MTIIDDNTVVVNASAELKNALENIIHIIINILEVI